MPWVDRDTYRWLREREAKSYELHDRLVQVQADRDRRREQVRHLRRTIHRLRSDVGAAVNTAVREAHAKSEEQR